MEPNRFEVITMTDKEQRDRIFADLRKNGEPNERQAVKFSGTQRIDGSIGNKFESTWSVAYPKQATIPNHGSARNPRKYPGRKVQA